MHTIQTDHQSLEWLDRLKENNSRLTHWSLALQPYQYSIQYRTGQRNGNADALSWYLVEATSVSQEVEGVSEKPTSAEAVGVDSFHGTGNGVQWQARSANKSLAQHVITEAQAKSCSEMIFPRPL